MQPKGLDSQEKFSPKRLFDQCIIYFVGHLECLAECDFSGNYLKAGLFSIDNTCDAFVEAYQCKGNVLDDRFLNTFVNPDCSSLKNLNLLNCEVKSEKTLWSLLKHKFFSLDLNKCSCAEAVGFLYHLNKYGSNLRKFSCGIYMSETILSPAIENNAFENWEYVINAPNLKSLKVMHLTHGCTQNFLLKLISPLKKLTELDLTGSGFLDLTSIAELPCLISLTLYKVNLDEDGLASIVNVSLKHLDISHIDITYEEPDLVLSSLIKRLKNLVSLDISGTNLAGYGNQIYGLSSRSENPLEFLGLYKTHHDACRRTAIPARLIAGNANIEQLINAGLASMQKSEIIKSILSDIYDIIEVQYEWHNMSRAVEFYLQLMNTHNSDEVVFYKADNLMDMICGKRPDELKKNWNLKQRLIDVAVNVVEGEAKIFFCRYDTMCYILSWLLPTLDETKSLVLYRLANAVIKKLKDYRNKSKSEFLFDLLFIVVRYSDQTVNDLLVYKWKLFQVLHVETLDLYFQFNQFSTACCIIEFLLADCVDYIENFVEYGGINILLCKINKTDVEEFCDIYHPYFFICLSLYLVALHHSSSIMTDHFLFTIMELSRKWERVTFKEDVYCLIGSLLAHMLSVNTKVWTMSTPKRDVLNELNRIIKLYRDITNPDIIMSKAHLCFGLAILTLTETDGESCYCLNDNPAILKLLEKAKDYKKTPKWKLNLRKLLSFI